MKRILCLILCAVMLCGLAGVSASADGTVTLVVTGGTAAPGETVEVLVSIENNPGISGFSGRIIYDHDLLIYQGYEAKTTKGSWFYPAENQEDEPFVDDPYIMWIYNGLTNPYTGTELIALQFKVAEDAAPGEYPVTLEIDPDWDGIVDGDNNTIEEFETVAGVVTVTGEEPEVLADGYYLIGQKGWDENAIGPELKFETNPNNTEEFLLETGLAVGDEIKVVRVANGAIAEWYPSSGGNYIVDAAHSGAKTIYFHPWYADAWSAFGGYIWIDAALGVVAEVYGSSVSLKGDIALNFYLIVPDELKEDSGAYVTLNDEKYMIAEATTRTVGEDTLYQFTVKLHAKQMTDEVVLRVYTGEDALVTLYTHSTGEDKTETGYVFTVQDYIQKTHENSTDEKLLALVDAMSDFGSLAQAQFNHNVESRVDVKADLSTVTVDDLATFAPKVTEGTATGLTYEGLTLVLESETVLRFYFTVDEGEIGDYTFKLGTKKVTPVEAGGKWYVEVANIAAKNLDKVYTVTVSNASGKIVTVKASALSYAYNVLSAEDADATLVDLVKGLYLYNKAADAYFG